MRPSFLQRGAAFLRRCAPLFLLDIALAFGLFALVQGVIWWFDPREALLFFLWSDDLSWIHRSLSGPRAEALRAMVAIWVGASTWIFWRGAPSKTVRTQAYMGTVVGGLWAFTDACSVLLQGALRPEVTLKGVAWIPGSLAITAILFLASTPGWTLRGEREKAEKKVSPWFWPLRGSVVALVAGLFLFHQVISMAHTDYRRPGDTVVVFGAAVWAGGRPSEALFDRVMTSVKLYKEGRAEQLLMTGGTGSNGYSEPEVMKNLAMEHGVPEKNILLDHTGRNTAASIQNLRRLQEMDALGRLLIVTHGHHTFRVRLACHRLDLRCYTVPAEQPRQLRREPFYLFREVVASAYYALTFRD